MNFEPMKNFMDELTSWIIPGNAISVYMGNNEVFSYSSGFADIENKIPMSCNSLINIYSATKVATATAALQLYEKGKFLLDEPLYEYIPEFKEMFVKDADGNIRKAQKPITLRHLFTMTSGIPYNNRKHLYEDAEKVKGAPLDTLDAARCIAKDYLDFEPGEKWKYGSSHDILAAVVEIISGKKFRDYVEENIFKPLGMNNSYFTNEHIRDKMAEQYKYVISENKSLVEMQSTENTEKGTVINCGKQVSGVLSNQHDNGGGGITSTVADYALFASALANGGVGKSGERILASSTIDLMRTNQLTPQQLSTFTWPQLKGYGYGLGVRTMMDKAAGGSCSNIGEFGWSGAAGATVLVDPMLGISMFYSHHMLNPQETYYMPRLRNILYTCINS